MTRNSDFLEKLQALVQPPRVPKNADAHGKRASIEGRLGTALPGDVFELAAIYGSGSFGTPKFSDVVEVFNPWSKSYLSDLQEIWIFSPNTRGLRAMPMSLTTCIRSGQGCFLGGRKQPTKSLLAHQRKAGKMVHDFADP